MEHAYTDVLDVNILSYPSVQYAKVKPRMVAPYLSAEDVVRGIMPNA
jgi:hypothetical protein